MYLVCVCHKLNFHRTANFASVSDTNPPDAAFANCSSDILTNNKTVTYEEPSATDLSDDGENLEVSCDYPPGSTFPENNMTLVICTARDSARNIAAENCNFTVTVGEEGSYVSINTDFSLTKQNPLANKTTGDTKPMVGSNWSKVRNENYQTAT